MRQLRADLRQYQMEALAAQRELTEAHRRMRDLESPVTIRIEKLLLAAREQAGELVAALKADAEASRKDADAYAADVRAAADRDAAALRAQGTHQGDQAREAAARRPSGC